MRLRTSLLWLNCGLLGIAAGGVIAVDRTSKAELLPAIGATDVLVGCDSVVLIPVKNHHFWRALRVDSVTTSCGCLHVESFDREVRPGEEGTICLIARVDPRIGGGEQSVTVKLTNGSSMTVPVMISPVAPFAGWPLAATATEANGHWNIDIAPEYEGALSDVLAFDESEEPLPAGLSDDGRLIRITAPAHWSFGAEHPEILLNFGNADLPNWSGPVVLQSDDGDRSDRVQ